MIMIELGTTRLMDVSVEPHFSGRMMVFASYWASSPHTIAGSR